MLASMQDVSIGPESNERALPHIYLSQHAARPRRKRRRADTLSIEGPPVDTTLPGTHKTHESSEMQFQKVTEKSPKLTARRYHLHQQHPGRLPLPLAHGCRHSACSKSLEVMCARNFLPEAYESLLRPCACTAWARRDAVRSNDRSAVKGGAYTIGSSPPPRRATDIRTALIATAATSP